MGYKTVQLPWKFEPRGYQLGLFRARERGVRRMVCVWHRRAGKDKCLLNLVVRDAMARVGAYYYYFPTAVWARKAIWDGMDKAGMQFRAHFPDEIVKGVKDREMQVELVNGSIFQIIGTDTLDVVGVNPVGCVFSEYSLQDPKAWQYITPILLENDGWAAFNFTPRGKNHAWVLYEMAKRSPEWYCEKLTILDTGAIRASDVEREMEQGIISKELAEQEYYCSFEFGMEGSIFGRYLREASDCWRIGEFPWEPGRKVYTFWDLGVSDATSIWFGQLSDDGGRVTMIDHVEERNRGLDYFIGVLEARGYEYGGHFAPHDAAQREKSTGVTLLGTAQKMGLRFELIPRTSSVESDIELVRRLLPTFNFDREKCSPGIASLSDYRRNEKTGKPEHDDASHSFDAFRTACRAVELGSLKAVARRAERDSDGFMAAPLQRSTGTLEGYDPLKWGTERMEHGP